MLTNVRLIPSVVFLHIYDDEFLPGMIIIINIYAAVNWFGLQIME